MSKYQTERDLEQNYETSLSAILNVIKELDWILVTKKIDGIVCKEYNTTPLSSKYTNDATIDITIDKSKKKIIYAGKNFGFGTIQSSHVKKQVLLVIEKIEESLKNTNVNLSPIITEKNKLEEINSEPKSISSELKNIADLLKNGILSEEEFEKVKQRILNR